jgi:hypothetical protein
LEALLNPPEPPFVAALPLYGVDHGGEANAERSLLGPPPSEEEWKRVQEVIATAVTMLSAMAPGENLRKKERAVRELLRIGVADWAREGEARQKADAILGDAVELRSQPWWAWAVDPLVKLQSKHTAIYCRVATSRERYPLQVDDTGEVMVDVALWRDLRAVAAPLLLDLRNGGVGSDAAREALLSLRVPPGCPRGVAATWRSRVAPLERHIHAPWWRNLFVPLLPMPELVKTPKEKNPQ